MTERLRWGDESLAIEIVWAESLAPSLAAVRTPDVALTMPEGLPLLEVLAIGHGHEPASDRLTHTVIGRRSRLTHHVSTPHELVLGIADAVSGAEAELRLTRHDGSAVLRSQVRVRNGGSIPLVLLSVASFAGYLGGDGANAGEWVLATGRSDWLAENRWVEAAVSSLLPEIAEHLTGHNPRGAYSAVSTGTWSTGRHLPMAVASSAALGAAWAWQVEHNGAWRWEVGRDTVDDYVALSGPTNADHAWTAVLEPGASFTTVPAAVAWGRDLEHVVGELTAYRRTVRRPHPDNHRQPIVFNDYMNTLNGDPTTEKLLPLVDAAAEAGAEVFCIDAGWYDDDGDWWPSVGEWIPSTSRFPGGLAEVVGRIRERGMVPGLWLEPEVVGVKSPLADRLPPAAFLQVAGQRLVEADRYVLDLRHPAARAHLDAVVDRLVEDLGIGYFKLDYNVDPKTGSDLDAPSTGAALLDHNRAHLAWIDGVLDRHPDLVLENCSSGAMRSDWAMLSRFQLQSTSDQQDFLRYPPIAASAPMLMLPEQAASWAYPQPGMTDEEIVFCLTTSLLGRFFLSGYLNRMSEPQLDLVREAVRVAKDLRVDITRARPFWPLGLPRWDDPWIVLGLATDSDRYLAIWNRDPENDTVTIPLHGAAAGSPGSTVTHFPRARTSWETGFLEESGELRVRNATGSVAARILRYPSRIEKEPTTASPSRSDTAATVNK